MVEFTSILHICMLFTHNFSLYLKFNFISKILSRRISISLCECVNTRKLFPGDESQIRKEKKKKRETVNSDAQMMKPPPPPGWSCTHQILQPAALDKLRVTWRDIIGPRVSYLFGVVYSRHDLRCGEHMALGCLLWREKGKLRGICDVKTPPPKSPTPSVLTAKHTPSFSFLVSPSVAA